MKKSKGRPKGSEKDDSRALSAMADMILADPALKPTPAIRCHNPEASEAEIRRLQSKWRERKDMLLTAARARAEARQRQEVRSSAPAGMHDLGAVAEAVRMASEIYNSPEMRVMREIQNSPTMRATRELHSSPTMRAIYEAQNSPAMRAVREFHSSPAARAIEEAHRKMNSLLGGF